MKEIYGNLGLGSAEPQYTQQILFTALLLPRTKYLTRLAAVRQFQPSTCTQVRAGERDKLPFEQVKRILKFLERAELSRKEKEL